jgi:hypothetical protein
MSTLDQIQEQSQISIKAWAVTRSTPLSANLGRRSNRLLISIRIGIASG